VVGCIWKNWREADDFDSEAAESLSAAGKKGLTGGELPLLGVRDQRSEIRDQRSVVVPGLKSETWGYPADEE